MGEALREWTRELAGWAVPEHILAGAEESPWVLPRSMFVRRVDDRLERPGGVTHDVAAAALGAAGTVLDVGAGAGAASLPLADALSKVTAVDADAGLLGEFGARAKEISVPYEVVHGRWPEVADRVEAADVVLCAHVLYNVADLEPFVTALSTHARGLVVVEIAEAHPLTRLNGMWRRFHGIERPSGPTVDTAMAALQELGISPEVVHWRKPATPEYERFEDLVEVTRRRLCLPAAAFDDVAAALRAEPERDSSTRPVATVSWPGYAN